jgi:2-polyprenyl-6-methoxyphenol hydroxylase-like FAD-dependent oxidoreductase
VGAVLALELARHGVRTVLAERATNASTHPKMDYLNGRSMELLRRLDLTDEMRRAGVAPEHPFNFLWSRHFDEEPIARWEFASVDDLTTRIAGSSDGTLPTEAHQRLQGSLLEEILRDRLRRQPLVDFRDGWTFEGMDAGDDGVTAWLTDGRSGRRHTVRAAYLVGCDGGASAVRQAAGIGVSQLGPTTRHRDVFFRSTDPVLRRHGRAFLTVAAGGLTLVSRDEKDTWTGTVHLADDAVAVEDPVALMRRNLGADFRVDEVLNVVEWEGRLAVADRYREGRVLLAGDAAHQFYPTGGHGANTGIADAVDLGWKLAALVHGWGGPRLLPSYEAERRPVGLFNREMCGNLLEVWLRFPRLVAGGATREHIAEYLAHEQYQMDNLGIHLGYRYDTSPIVCHEDGPAPRWEWGRMTPTTWPGSRVPTARTADGRWVTDRLGTGLTLVDLSGAYAGESLVEQSRERGIPMTHAVVDDDAVRALWERDLVLVRPDQHVAWRGDGVPADWPGILDRVTGR